MTATFTKRAKTAVVAVAAVAIVTGSFYVASGSVLTGSGSLLASAITAVTGKPTIFIGKDGASPAGSIKAGVNQTLAVFDISAKNTTNWATLHASVFRIVIASSGASPVTVSNVAASYHYCVSPSTTYGYGWKGGNCATTQLIPASVVRDGANYVATFYQDIAIYPENSYGAITVTGTPTYQYTGTKMHTGAGDGTLRVQVSSLSGVGDQCKWTLINSNTHGYGYANCVSMNAVMNIQSAANLLRVTRPYGYGYLAKPVTLPVSAKTR